MSENTKQGEVKPCPFCGEQPKVTNESGYDAGTDIRCPNTNCEPQPYVFIPLGTVKTPTHKESEQAAVELWNRRSSISLETAQKLADELVRLQSILDMLYNHNAAVRGAVVQYYGTLHNNQSLEAFNAEKAASSGQSNKS